MVLDCRWVNEMHRRPPHIRLGSSTALGELNFSEMAQAVDGGQGAGADPFCGTLDLQDCFYQYLCPELCSWFSIDDDVSTCGAGVSSVDVSDDIFSVSASI